MSSMLNERLTIEISQRLRTLLLPLPGYNVERVAQRLNVALEPLRLLLDPRQDAMIDTDFLIDVLAAVVHEYGCDSSWLLTGVYRQSTHQKLEEDGPLPVRSVREIVAQQIATAS